MNSKLYDALKWIALVCLPAIGGFYCMIAGIWGLPYAEQIVGTILAIAVCLGALLGISSHAYNKRARLKIPHADS